MASNDTTRVLGEPIDAQAAHHNAAKHNFMRNLFRAVARGTGKGKESTDGPSSCEEDPTRPQTAPFGTTTSKQHDFSTIREPPLVRLQQDPPPRPPRPDSDVLRDVNAWLDASVIKPAPAIMSGIPYWRDGSAPRGPVHEEVRYAVPIVRAPNTRCGGQIQKLYHRPKVPARMSSLVRARTNQAAAPCLLRASKSMPLLSLGTGTVESTPSPKALKRSRRLLQLFPRPSNPQLRPDTAGSSTPSGPVAPLGHRLNTDALPPSPITPRFAGFSRTTTRQDSIGNLSEVPTYSSGAPPPSYRSHAASVRSTSSFGCIDGMHPDGWYDAESKASIRHGSMRGKLKKLARKARLRK